MFDVNLVQALPVSHRGPPLCKLWREEAGVVPEVVEEGSQSSGQDGDSDHGATPLVKIG